MSTPIDMDAELPPEMAELMAYVDGELDEQAAAAFEAKMATDPRLAAQAHALIAVGEFVHADRDRINDKLGVDRVADHVMKKLSEGRQSAAPPTAMPETSPQARSRKGTVIWIAFGTVCAAAAALILYVGRGTTPNDTAVMTNSLQGNIDSGAVKAPGSAVAKAPELPPDPSRPVDESTSIELRDIELGEGATVILSREHEDGPSTATVWIEDKAHEETER